MEINNSNDEEGEGFEVVSKFVNLLGSSAGLVSSLAENGGGALEDCFSPSIDYSNVVCTLPSFRVVEEEQKPPVAEAQQPTDSTQSPMLQSLQDVLETSMRSVFPVTTEDPKEEISVDDNVEEEHIETEFFDEFTKLTIDDAPLALLRSLQDAFRQHSRSRLNEWKALLKKHPSHDAQKLVKLLSYHKMIAGCRGNTRLSVVGHVDDKEQGRDCEMGMDSETDSLTTNSSTTDSLTTAEEEASVRTQLPGLTFRLDVEFFVKIRHGPRTFATSCFTLAFDTLGIVRYSLNPSDGLLDHVLFECDQSDLLQRVKNKAHALVLNAIGYQAAESVRWTRTLLTDLWEAERMARHEDSASDNMSLHSFSTRGTFASYVSSLTNGSSSVDTCPPTDPESCLGSNKKSKRPWPRSRCCVPMNITTTSNAEKSKGWQHSILYQVIAFVFLFMTSLKFMKAKEFCHSLFRRESKGPILEAYYPALRRQPTEESLQSSPKGVSFHRVIGKFPEDSEFVLDFEEKETQCEAFDEFGVNDCHFDWDDQVAGNFSTAISQVLDKSSSLHADLVLEGHIPYKIDCALCGQPCEIGLPMINFQYSLHMPPCPVDLTNHFQDFRYQLWKHSPSEGLVSISVEGSATVYSSPDEKLAEFEVSGAIR